MWLLRECDWLSDDTAHVTCSCVIVCFVYNIDLLRCWLNNKPGKWPRKVRNCCIFREMIDNYYKFIKEEIWERFISFMGVKGFKLSLEEIILRALHASRLHVKLWPKNRLTTKVWSNFERRYIYMSVYGVVTQIIKVSISSSAYALQLGRHVSSGFLLINSEESTNRKELSFSCWSLSFYVVLRNFSQKIEASFKRNSYVISCNVVSSSVSLSFQIIKQFV